MWRAAGTNAEPLGWLSKITLERFHLDTLHPPGRPQGSPPRSTPPPPLLLSAACHDPLVVIVRAGEGWSGVGTLAVALTMPHRVGCRFRTSRCSATRQDR